MAKARTKRCRKNFFGKLFPNRKTIKNTPDITDFPFLGKLAFLLAGALLMLTAVDLIHLEPSKFIAPRLVVLGLGVALLCIGLLTLIAKYRHSFPALYMLVAAVMCSTFAAIFTWAAVWARGPFGGSFSFGPLAMLNDTHDMLERLGFGMGAIFMIVLSALAWWRWWRAMSGKKIDLS